MVHEGPARVVVVDDDRRFREAVAAVLDADPRFELVGEAGSADEAGDLVARTRPDCVLVDVRMPGGGPAAVRAVLDVAPRAGGAAETGAHRPPVLVAVSADAHLTAVVEMLEAGVSGYLVKGALGDVLTDRLDRCLRGEVVLEVPNAADALSELHRRVTASG